MFRKLVKCFSRDPLYVTMSRLQNSSGLRIITKRTLENKCISEKVVYIETLMRVNRAFIITYLSLYIGRAFGYYI